MLYEYILILDFILLTVVLFFLNTRKSNPKLIIVLSLILIIEKMSLLFLLPSTITLFTFPPRKLLHLFFMHFIYTIFWLLWFYLFLLKKDIIKENLKRYERNLRIYGSIVVISNFAICGLQMLNAYVSFFSFDFFYANTVLTPYIVDYALLNKIILVVFAFHTYFFIRLVLFRAHTILRLYGTTFLFLFILITLQWFYHTLDYLGWNTELDIFVKLFTFDYGYAGIVGILLFGVTVFTHFMVLLLNYVNKFLAESRRKKSHLLYFAKCGYLSMFLLILLQMFPFFF